MAWTLLACAGPVFAHSASTERAAADDATSTVVDGQGRYVEVDTSRPLLAGLFVDGKDTGRGIDLLRRAGGYAVDVEELARALDLPLKQVGDTLRLQTPLGPVSWPLKGLIRRGHQRFMPLSLFETRTGARLRFDVGEFALRVDLPWRPGAGASGRKGGSGHAPDVLAPRLSLSRWHSEVYASRVDGHRSLSSLTDLGGAMGEGYWRLRYRTRPGGQSVLQDYGWLLDRGNGRLMLGHDQLVLDPLLPYTELTGAQYAWTNRPRVLFDPHQASQGLVSDPLQSGRRVSGGDGPPGGIAELRVDGRAVARTAIRMDGSWQFEDTLLRPGDHAEVALYKRFGDGAPVRIVQVGAGGRAQVLPAGTVLAYGGLGVDGNPLDPAVGTRGGAGFFQLRYGLDRHLTLGTTLQRTADGAYATAQAAMALGPAGGWTVGVGRHGRAGGWSVQGDGDDGTWFWHAYALHDDAGYLAGQVAASNDRYAEFGRRLGSRLDLSLVGRSVDDPLTGDHYRFVRPAVDWRPSDAFSVDARPDYRGSYAYSIDWTPSASDRASLSRYVGRTQLAWDHALAGTRSLELSATHDDRTGSRLGALLSGIWTRWRPLQWTAGIFAGEHGHDGYLLDAGIEAVPGLSAHLQVVDDPLNRLHGGGPLLQMVLVADFAVTPSGLARGEGGGLQIARRGAISGRIRATLPDGVHWKDLAGTDVLVDGHPAGRLDASGHFLLQNLSPGVHHVQLDADTLPIDLSPPYRQPWVQVRSGVTTRVDFRLQLSIGFAGRLLDARGRPVVDGSIRVVDGSGAVVAHARSDRWGYYRVDGLAPGRYTVTSGPVSRAVTLRRRFLFGQDLRR